MHHFKLWVLLLIQSHAVYSTFRCSDLSKENKTKDHGVCVRKVVDNDWLNTEVNDFDLTVGFLRLDANAKGGDLFTCDGLKIAEERITTRYCCDLVKDIHIRPITQGDLNLHCYTRDAKKARPR
ncbi:hypothetical protein PTTG_28678 [Puccinia triticina 1-1 BBBD Race 1]|uniref:Cyanovirin-N domain-containing protein n=2 Tax=Puccinia triticina TaxID=208348 RepID=A0A180GAU1_PUCT1|nr:uncharacterized protein PtA15_13A366 [Puccinia triticina]OAV89452.1 hypothetical protein PTTG_28678 [Puccinia triticina 1-1 BBBD Race 1]WAQ90966.1 hypothetical protein PtA15_13A366 [Puccinia triticina]WAR61154.1 hypothetical protein PtB15_13B406 [Puccinia triticina]